MFNMISLSAGIVASSTLQVEEKKSEPAKETTETVWIHQFHSISIFSSCSRTLSAVACVFGESELSHDTWTYQNPIRKVDKYDTCPIVRPMKIMPKDGCWQWLPEFPVVAWVTSLGHSSGVAQVETKDETTVGDVVDVKKGMTAWSSGSDWTRLLRVENTCSITALYII